MIEPFYRFGLNASPGIRAVNLVLGILAALFILSPGAPVLLTAQTNPGDFQLHGVNLSGTLPWMNANGQSISVGEMATADGRLTLKMPVGTILRSPVNQNQLFIAANPLNEPPPAPAQQKMIYAYSLGTPGAIASPGIYMEMLYDDAALPADIAESSLFIARLDGSNWVKMTSFVDSSRDLVSASVTSFTTFALMGVVQAIPSLSIQSPESGSSFSGGDVTLSVTAGNFKPVSGNWPNTSGEGHFIYYLDVALPITPGQSALSAPGTYVESVSETNTWSGLTPGPHTLGVQLVQNDGKPFNPPVYATVSVSVESPATSVPIETTPVESGNESNDFLVPALLALGAVLLVALLLKARSR